MVRSVSGAHDAQLAHVLQPLGDLLLAGGLRLPERDRVGVEQVAGRVDEVLPLGQRHAGVLRGGVARERRPAPAHLSPRLALEEALEQRPRRRRADRLAVGVDAAREAVVALPPDAERPRRRLHLDLVQPGDRAQLRVACLGQERGLRPLQARAHHRVGAQLGHLAHQLDEQGLGERRAVDQHRVALPDLERVAAQHVGQRRQSGVAHRSRMLATFRTGGEPRGTQRDESTASRIRPAPNLTGSSATRPVSRSVSAIAVRAASSSIRFVFSATATTGAGRTCRAIRTWSSISSAQAPDRDTAGCRRSARARARARTPSRAAPTRAAGRA